MPAGRASLHRKDREERHADIRCTCLLPEAGNAELGARPLDERIRPNPRGAGNQDNAHDLVRGNKSPSLPPAQGAGPRVGCGPRVDPPSECNGPGAAAGGACVRVKRARKWLCVLPCLLLLPLPGALPWVPVPALLPAFPLSGLVAQVGRAGWPSWPGPVGPVGPLAQLAHWSLLACLGLSACLPGLALRRFRPPSPSPLGAPFVAIRGSSGERHRHCGHQPRGPLGRGGGGAASKVEAKAREAVRALAWRVCLPAYLPACLLVAGLPASRARARVYVRGRGVRTKRRACMRSCVHVCMRACAPCVPVRARAGSDPACPPMRANDCAPMRACECTCGALTAFAVARRICTSARVKSACACSSSGEISGMREHAHA